MEQESESEPDKAEESNSSSKLKEKSREKRTFPLVFTEAAQKLEGHSLGVTALASSPGVFVCTSSLECFCLFP